MTLKEMQLLSEGLWESVKTDLKFFSPIQLFVKRLAEMDFSEQTDLDDAEVYINKIEEFFTRYRKTPDSDVFYFEPALITLNSDSVKKIHEIISNFNNLDRADLRTALEQLKPKQAAKSKGGGQIFIGHGRSKLWARVQVYLKDDLSLTTLTYEDESRTSETIINILEDFLNKSSFAILIMTAEDETAEGTSRARQNVIHEAGLFQGRLGFDKVIILKQDGIEEFSNIAGLQYIAFSQDNIEQCFYELQRRLKKMGLVK